MTGGFAGGSAVKSPSADAVDKGLIPDPGRSHMPRGDEAHVPQPLGLWSHCSEKLVSCNEEKPPPAATRESLLSKEDRRSQKAKKTGMLSGVWHVYTQECVCTCMYVPVHVRTCMCKGAWGPCASWYFMKLTSSLCAFISPKESRRIILMSLFAGKEWRGRCRKQTCEHSRGGREWDEWRE